MDNIKISQEEITTYVGFLNIKIYALERDINSFKEELIKLKEEIKISQQIEEDESKAENI